MCFRMKTPEMFTNRTQDGPTWKCPKAPMPLSIILSHVGAVQCESRAMSE